MTLKNSLPCKKCGTVDWYEGGACKQCTKDRARVWKAENPDKVRASGRKYRRENHSKILDRHRRYRKAHPEIYRENARRWAREHPEQVKERKRRGQKANLGAAKARNSRRRAQKRGNGGSHTAAQWEAIKKRYNNTCLCCHRQEPEIKLTKDHVLPIELGGSDNADNLQPLCLSCNCSKKARHIDYRPGKVFRWIQQKLFG